MRLQLRLNRILVSVRAVRRTAAFGLMIIGLVAQRVEAQRTPREVRVEVRDLRGAPVQDARIEILPSSDTALTDDKGIARLTTAVDTALVISVRRLGYAERTARFVVGNAPAFIVRVRLGDIGARLPEVTVTENYPGEPWRPEYEDRRKRVSGSFRDRSYFKGREPRTLEDWFVGIPGATMTGRGLRVNRCPRLGVWIDGMHVTAPGLSSALALMQLPAMDIAAIELYRLAQQQAQYSDPNREDCSLLVWTRGQ
jgi:hypothetical protein